MTRPTAFLLAWIGRDGRVVDVGIYSEGVESITIVDRDGAMPACLQYSYHPTFDGSCRDLLDAYRTRHRHLAALFPIEDA